MAERLAELVVTIFDREVTIAAEKMDGAASTLILLTCLEGMGDGDRETLERASRIVRELSLRPGGEG